MDPHALSSTISSNHTEDLWRRHSLLAPCCVETHTAPADVISSLITSLSEALETVPDLDNDHAECWVSQAKGIRGMAQETYDFPSPPNGDVQPNPSNLAIPPVLRTFKSSSSLSPLTVPKPKSLKIRVRPISSESQTLKKGHPGQFTAATHISRKVSIEPSSRHSSLNIVEKGEDTKLQLRKTIVLTSSKEGLREIDRELRRSPINPSNGYSRNSPKRSPISGIKHSPSVGLPLPLNDCWRANIRLNLPSIPARSSSIKTTSSTKKVIRPVEERHSSITDIKRVPTRDSSLRHNSSLTPKRRSQRLDHQSDEKSPSRKQCSSVSFIEKTAEDTMEDGVMRRIQELRAQKDRRSRQFIEDSQSSIVNDLSLLSLPIKPVLRRTISHDSQALHDSMSINYKSLRTQEDILTYVDGKNSRPNIIQKELVAKNSTVLVTPSSSFAQAKSVLRTMSTPQIKHLSFPRRSEPEFAKHAFSSPLSQVARTSQYYDTPSLADPIDKAIEDYLFSYRLSQKIQHPQTSRIISFSEVGDPKGYAVFCCIGMGLTRYVTAFYDELALKLKLRLITPERPGIGESEAYADGSDTPLGWPDDILQICQHLEITRFSLLAHSAGAVYALATALRMPHFIRGRIHLLAPWIPPSQMTATGTHQEPLPLSALPYSQRILRALPVSFLKAANSSFLNTTSASVITGLGKPSWRSKRKSLYQDTPRPKASLISAMTSRSQESSFSLRSATGIRDSFAASDVAIESNGQETEGMTDLRPFTTQRQTEYDLRLTRAIWNLATMEANPAVDLVVCLERRQPIGFRYVDVGKAVVIHHGSKDSRVPADNVKWLSNAMRRCEVRILEGEGHALMASATVMGDVLVEIGKEWEDWNSVVQGKKGRLKTSTLS